MINKPLARFPGGFTVLMAVYKNDNPSLFVKAVGSVFDNTLVPDICLVVVDGPIGAVLRNSIKELEKKYGKKIDFIWLEKNYGLAEALNVGLQKIFTTWVVRADADDFNLPERFAVLANAVAENSQIELVGSDILEVDAQGKPIAIRSVPVDEGAIRRFSRRRNPFNHMSVAYRLDAILECGGYPQVFLKEDYALWCQFLARQKVVKNIPRVLVRASAGREMYMRRGGWQYARSEWEMQKILINAGIKGYGRGIIDGIMRAGFFLIPSWLRGYIYIKLLRNPKN